MRLSATPKRRASFSRYFWPISIALTRSVALMTCLILLRARDVLTSASQSLLGRWPACVRISTTSPFFRLYFSGTMRPLTFAPTQVLPTSLVDGVGEVDGRGVARQHDHAARGVKV